MCPCENAICVSYDLIMCVVSSCDEDMCELTDCKEFKIVHKKKVSHHMLIK